MSKKEKWNRRHEFLYKKETKTTKRHPAYIFRQSKNRYRYLLFTTQPHTNGVDNISLKKNINPMDTRVSHVRDGYFEDDRRKFDPVTDRKFEIHDSDRETIRGLRNKPFVGKQKKK